MLQVQSGKDAPFFMAEKTELWELEAPKHE